MASFQTTLYDRVAYDGIINSAKQKTETVWSPIADVDKFAMSYVLRLIRTTLQQTFFGCRMPSARNRNTGDGIDLAKYDYSGTGYWSDNSCRIIQAQIELKISPICQGDIYLS